MIKVMIVDDERNIRKGIVQLIDWQKLGCEVVIDCSDGKDALQYLQDHPIDIVVTDIKMPSIDGIELSKRIKEDFKDTKVIILTAYSDFAFAQKAIKYNVVDFIIKNDFIEELPIAIDKTIQLIVKERENNNAKDTSTDEDMYLTQMFNKLISSGNVSNADIELYRLNDFNYCLCACEIDYFDKDKDKSNLTNMLKNILNIALKDCFFVVIPLSETHMIIIIQFDKSSQINLNDIIKFFNDIIIMVEEFMRIDIRFGLSQLIQNPKDIKLGYEEAKESLSKIIIKGSELQVYNVIKNEEDQEFSLDVDHYIGKICELTFDGESGQANNLLHNLYDKLVSSNCSFEQCKMYMLVICSSIIRKAVRYHTDQDFNAMEKEVYELIQCANTMFSLVSIGNNTIDRLRNSCKDKKDFKNELVKRADECIRNHYKEELTLQFISQELYLNSSYLSRAYKKWTGNTITEAINMYRISKAKVLLITSVLKIYEVAQAVGFQDAAYFTNVFLKYVGQNPTEYRQEHT